MLMAKNVSEHRKRIMDHSAVVVMQLHQVQVGVLLYSK